MEFPTIDPSVIHEDRILPIRALLKGQVGYINRPLIHYRIGGISYHYDKIDIRDYLFGQGNLLAQRYVCDYQQKLKDLQHVQADPALISLAKKQLAQWQLIAFLGKERRLTWQLVRKTLKQGGSLLFLIKNTVKYLLPGPYHFIVHSLKKAV